jgi:DNA ligase-1
MTDVDANFNPNHHTLIESLPVLYCTEKNGKTRVWVAKIYLKGKSKSAQAQAQQAPAFATIEHGQLDGKLQLTIREYTEGKNIGRKNETTPLQQCIAETKRKWTDKHEKESYQETIQDEASASASAPDQQPPPHQHTKKYFPMLAHTFEPATITAKKNNIVFPCFVQPKLDGLRCIMYRDPITTELHCQSRTGAYFDTMDHIKTSLASVFAKHPAVVFDGELYTTEIPFEELAGLIKKKKLTPSDKDRLRAIEYHIYDIVDETKPFEDRHAMLRKIFAQNAASRMASPHVTSTSASTSDHLPQFIRLVPTTEAKTPANFKALFSEFIDSGYEGIMLRNKKGMYRCNYRSHDLQKYKEFLEDEFLIVGFTQGDGRDKGTIIWICVTKEGKEFSVRPRGTMEHRRKLFQTGEKYVGKKLTIIYQELTEEGKPRFPVGKDVRDKY